MEIRCFRCHTLNPKKLTTKKSVIYHCLDCGYKSGQAYVIDHSLKVKYLKGKIKHFTTAILAERAGKFLIMKKRTYPFWHDIIAGHINREEKPLSGAKRELREETGLRAKNCQLVFHNTIKPDPCWRGSNIHEWNVYHCSVNGKLKKNIEAEYMRWLSPKQFSKLKFVRPMAIILKSLGYITKRRAVSRTN